MLEHHLAEIYSAYLAYKPKTNNGILWGITNDYTVLTKLEDENIVENKIKDIKIHFNPIERMVERVDIGDIRDIPLIVVARACIEDSFLYDVEIKSVNDEDVGFGCAIKFRDCRDIVRVLTFSEKFKFSLQEMDNENKLKTVDCNNQYVMYQRLFELHMNMFGRNKNAFGLQENDFIIKENINPDVLYNPFISPD